MSNSIPPAAKPRFISAVFIPRVEATRAFFTSCYEGAWFSFEGDRMALRKRIEEFLREQDPKGRLEVREDGPHWISTAPLYLSYSHTEGAALLVWSRIRALGVDVEAASRKLQDSPLRIAERFFHEREIAELRAIAPHQGDSGSLEALQEHFLRLWLKKEALGKLTRSGLRGSIGVEVAAEKNVTFEEAPLVPEGFRAIVALAERRYAVPPFGR